jgi:hypothetical protein
LCIRKVYRVWVLLQLIDQRLGRLSKNDLVDQWKVLLFYPIAFAALRNAAEPLSFLVTTFTPEEKVPDVIIRTMLSMRRLELLVTLTLTFHPHVPPD